LLVELLANERAAAEIVARDGVTVQSAAGTSKPNPAMRSLEIARAQAVPLLRQFGLLPAGPPRRASNDDRKQPSMNGKSPWRGVLK
jgi:phage terminase small subunit